jgi:branched-chain amino acid transport system permease protein
MRLLGYRIEWLGALALLILLAALAPLFVFGKFATLEWTYVWAFAIAILGLNLLTGYSGQISIGNGAFMAIGGYTSAILQWKLGWSYLVTLPLAGLLAGVGGFLFGFPALKLKGLYLALGTFALALAAPSVIRHYSDLTGGHQGINLRSAKDPFGLVASQQLTSEQWLYYLSLVLLLLLMLFARAVIRSRTGRAFKAIRDNETAAVANGISLTYYKTLAFGLSAFYAGIAGGLYAIITAYVSPDSFDVGLSFSLLVGLVVGGLGTLAGPVLGAIFVIWLPIFTQGIKIPFSGLDLRPDIAFSVILILMMKVIPVGAVGGIYQGLAGFQARRRRRGRLPGGLEIGTDPEVVAAAPIEAEPKAGN